MTMNSCTKGNDKTCTDLLGADFCCASWSVKTSPSSPSADQQSVIDVLKLAGFPTKTSDAAIHSCYSKTVITTIKGEFDYPGSGITYKLFCDGASVKAVLAATAAALYAASTF